MKHYKQGDECTFPEDSEEYRNLKEFAELLTQNSPKHQEYVVKDCYLDFGQRWMWTTILNVTEGFQALCPRDWLDIVNRDRDYKEILAEMLKAYSIY